MSFFWPGPIVQDGRRAVGWRLASALGRSFTSRRSGIFTPRSFGFTRSEVPYLPEFAIISATVGATVYLCRQPRRLYAKILIVLLTIVSCFATWKAGLHGIDSARAHLKRQSIHTEIVTSYLKTGNHQLLFDLPAYKTPYWNSNELAVRLESADLVRILPFELRADSQRPNSINAEKPDSPGRLTFLVVTMMRYSRILAASGATLFLFALFLPRQQGGEKVMPSTLQ